MHASAEAGDDPGLAGRGDPGGGEFAVQSGRRRADTVARAAGQQVEKITPASATPNAMLACMVVLSPPEPDPAPRTGTSVRMRSTSAAATRPNPNPATTSGGSICQEWMPGPKWAPPKA